MINLFKIKLHYSLAIFELRGCDDLENVSAFKKKKFTIIRKNRKAEKCVKAVQVFPDWFIIFRQLTQSAQKIANPVCPFGAPETVQSLRGIGMWTAD